MATATKFGDDEMQFLFQKQVDHRVGDGLFGFRQNQDFALKAPIQTVGQAFGPKGLPGRLYEIYGKCNSGLTGGKGRSNHRHALILPEAGLKWQPVAEIRKHGLLTCAAR
jgi:hypothetical protein